MHLLKQLINKTIKLNSWLLVIGTILFLAVSSLIFYAIEPKTFQTPFIALWYVMTTVTTVGYGDVYPVTNPGRLYALFIYIFGIGLIGVFIGKVIDVLGIYRKRSVEGKLTYHGSNHIIIIGWGRKSEVAVNEILNTSTDVDVVIIDQLPESPLLKEHVFYIQGKAANDEILKQANLEKARSVIIFADENIADKQLTDGKTLLIVTSVERYMPSVHTMVEITDESNVKNFHFLNVDDFMLSHDIISKLAVRGIFNVGISSVYNRLINRMDGETFYYITGKRSNWQTYRDAFNDLLNQGATLIGDGADLNINRRLDEKLPDHIKLCVLCNDQTYNKLKEISNK